jgi:diaminopimelate decarboxylase
LPQKTFPLSRDRLEEVMKTQKTPFHLYDEKGIRANARELKQAFAAFPDFTEFFAVKALPNPFILRILNEEGFGADCSSLPELLLAERSGISGEKIIFSSNDTPADEFLQARKMGAILNLDDMSHIDFLEKTCGSLPELICFRYNPGSLRQGNAIIGKPEEAKYGFTRDQLLEGYRMAKERGVKRFGLHTMLASNELDYRYFIETGRMLFQMVAELSHALDIRFEFVNIGGGIGIPYRPEQTPVDYRAIADGIGKAYRDIIEKKGLGPVKVFMECGRIITGPYGWLVTTVRHMKHTYRDYVGLDASMANLMRPGIYGAYHHITVVGKENEDATSVYDVTGSLCENNDKFAIQRALPEIVPGDIVVIHDTGAHGHAMGFNYNGKLRSAELLLREDGSIIKIRREETVEDYFGTLDFGALENFR